MINISRIANLMLYDMLISHTQEYDIIFSNVQTQYKRTLDFVIICGTPISWISQE